VIYGNTITNNTIGKQIESKLREIERDHLPQMTHGVASLLLEDDFIPWT